jgi:hypothetical protein
VDRVSALVILALALSGAVLSACGGSGANAPAATQNTTTAKAETKSPYLQTLEPDWASYTAGLAKESATCPVPKVTVRTMNECKRAMVALNKIDKKFILDLRSLEVPPALQPAISELRASLAALNRAHTTIIRRYIDKHDIDGFKNSAGPGSPLDTATMGSNDAITQINLLDPSAELEATVFTPPS